MSEMAAFVRGPSSVEGSFELPSTGLTNCNLDPATSGEDGAALLELGITRSVQHWIPGDAVTPPLQGVPDNRSATRFVIDAPPPDDATLRHLHDLGVRGVRY